MTKHHTHPSRNNKRASTPTPAPSPTRTNNLGPLTTTFTQSSTCTNLILECTTCTKAYLGRACDSYERRARDELRCWPSITSLPSFSPEQDGPINYFTGLGFYSPGIICPSGYISACGASGSPSKKGGPQTSDGNTKYNFETPGPISKSFQFPLEPAEFGVGCCPQSFSCTNYGDDNQWQTCHRPVTSARFLTAGQDGTCNHRDDRADFEKQFIVPQEGGRGITSLDVWAPMIQIVWQETDIPQSSSPIPAFPSTTGDPTDTHGNDDAGTVVLPKPAQHQKDDGLSAAAVAGLSLSICLVVLSVLGLAIYWCIRRRRPKMIIPVPKRGSAEHELQQRLGSGQNRKKGDGDDYHAFIARAEEDAKLTSSASSFNTFASVEFKIRESARGDGADLRYEDFRDPAKAAGAEYDGSVGIGVGGASQSARQTAGQTARQSARTSAVHPSSRASATPEPNHHKSHLSTLFPAPANLADSPPPMSPIYPDSPVSPMSPVEMGFPTIAIAHAHEHPPPQQHHHHSFHRAEKTVEESPIDGTSPFALKGGREWR